MVADVLVYPDDDLTKRWEEDPDKFEHMLSLLQNWVHYQRHLPQRFSRRVLTHFLRSCKMDLEKAKKKFEVFCYLPQTCEKFYANRAESLKRDVECLDFVYTAALPELTEEGYRISVTKVINIEKLEILSLYRTATLIADYRLHNEVFLNGEILICDLQNAAPQFYGKMFNPLLLLLVRIGMDTYPCRVKKIFILSCHPLLEKGISVCKTVLPEKMRDRFYFFHDLADLCKHIPAKYLPSDYNGEQESLATLVKNWKETLLESVDFFKAIDDIKPLGPIPKHIPLYNDDNLGVDGSFRKLNID